MQGQWIGSFSGTQPGVIRLEIDQSDRTYWVTATISERWPANQPYTPPFLAVFNFIPDQINESPTYVLNLAEGVPFPPETVRQLYPHALYPRRLRFTMSSFKDAIHVRWVSEGGVGARAIDCVAELKRSLTAAGAPSSLNAIQVTDLTQFQQAIDAFPVSRFVFRGQSMPWRLRTSFHRLGRANIQRYLNEDISYLARTLAGQTHHFFDSKDPVQRGAFFNLLQHHGYPTPLLDWTLSPYVALFFAFQGVRRDRLATANPGTVRIFAMNRAAWRSPFDFFGLVHNEPHVTFFEPSSLNNARLIPQQGISAISTVDDIESFIAAREATGGMFLHAIDMPAALRPKIMSQLRMMGITAGSLFPGIDGACEAAKELFFE